MDPSVYKVVEIVGTSRANISEAIEGAIERASHTLDDLRWFEVKEIRGKITDDQVAEFQVKLDVGFLLHAHETRTSRTSVAVKRPPSRTSRSTASPVAAKKGERRRGNVVKSYRKK